MQLSVRGNQNEGFDRVREMPTTVKNKELKTNTINQSIILLGAPKHPKKTTILSPHLCDNCGFVAVGLPNS